LVDRFTLRHAACVITAFLTVLDPVSIAFAQSPATGGAPGDGGPATEAVFVWPSGIAIDARGNIFVAERRANRVRRIDASTGKVTTAAGTGDRGYSGDGGPASEARISIPELIAVDDAGNLYITDRGNARIRRVDASTGVISTFAGTGNVGYDGDHGLATEATLSYPFGVHADSAGDVYIADTENHVVRRVDGDTGVIATVAGSGVAGYAVDGGRALEAQLNRPHNFAFDLQGRLVIGDSQNQRIRRVDLETGIITTLYGSGEQGTSPDGIHASEAAFAYFGSLLIADDGDLLVAGWVDNRIRRIDAESGIISTIAGNGTPGYSGDGGPATEAQIHGPYGMALHPDGSLYIAEAENGVIRRVDLESGTISTVAGTPSN